MTHTVDKSAAVSCFLFQYLCKEVCDLALIVPVLNIFHYAALHFKHLVVGTAVTGTFKGTDSCGICSIGVCARRCKHTAGKCGVVSAAVLCVENKGDVKHLCFKLGELAVGAEQVEYVLCCGIFGHRLVDYKALAVKVIIFALIAVNCDKGHKCDKLQRLSQDVGDRCVVGIIVIGKEGENTS